MQAEGQEPLPWALPSSHLGIHSAGVTPEPLRLGILTLSQASARTHPMVLLPVSYHHAVASGLQGLGLWSLKSLPSPGQGPDSPSLPPSLPLLLLLSLLLSLNCPPRPGVPRGRPKSSRR